MARSAANLFMLLLMIMIQLHLDRMPVQSYVVGESPGHSLPTEKVTRLRFFLQDFITTRNATAVRVARANRSPVSPFLFGDVYVIDDPLTADVDSSSAVIGNAQGIYALTGLEGFSIFMAVDFGFTAGEYNGSSITVLSRNPLSETPREMAVVGGRGKFRLARGFATLTTRFWSGLDAIVEYNVTVLHY